MIDRGKSLPCLAAGALRQMWILGKPAIELRDEGFGLDGQSATLNNRTKRGEIMSFENPSLAMIAHSCQNPDRLMAHCEDHIRHQSTR
jgi:hypothetical protein